ncbi:dihydropteroate synthase [soil metagenome]
MATLYHRPLALLYGSDARDAIADKRAGLLGGSPSIAFTQLERIERGGKRIARSIISYRDAGSLPDIEAPRAAVAGLNFLRPNLMGVVNVTPDSFSDGGEHSNPETAITHGRILVKEGAAFLDIGGESTRPGSDPVSAETERARILSVIAALRDTAPVSADTRKAAIMADAVAAGAALINDVSALTFDTAALATAARLGVPVILMHSQGDPKTMQADPRYDDVALDVYDMLKARIAACEAAGIPRAKILADPGIGFGKTFDHNLALLHQLTLFHGLGVPLVAGLSRKAFTGALTGEKLARNRVMGSVGGAVQAALAGAQILRVHDVKATRQALAVALAIAGV